MTLRRRLGWLSFLSVGTKLAIGALLWMGVPYVWAAVLMVLALAGPLIKIFRTGSRENFWETTEAKRNRLREDSVIWVSISSPAEVYTSGREGVSRPKNSPDTLGRSDAPRRAATTVCVLILKRTLRVLKPHTPALMTEAPRRMDGVSL